MNDAPNNPGGNPPESAAQPEQPAQAAQAAQAAAGDPNARIAELEAEIARLKDQALRALAEQENTRRRAQRDIEENSKFAVSNFARDVLPVGDNLRRALETITAEARAADPALAKFAEGVELTERELLNVLERYGIKRIDPVGQPFDHNLHQAMMQVENATQPPGTVVQVFQPGYTIHGRLLRPAMVTVAKGSPAGAPGAKVDTTA
jgi:molecular chaperone GrpE